MRYTKPKAYIDTNALMAPTKDSVERALQAFRDSLKTSKTDFNEKLTWTAKKKKKVAKIPNKPSISIRSELGKSKKDTNFDANYLIIDF